MHLKFLLKGLQVVILLFSFSTQAAVVNNDFATFDNIFKEWTSAFNTKELSKSCALFAPSLRADYQGV
jgi:hypothetical protein